MIHLTMIHLTTLLVKFLLAMKIKLLETEFYSFVDIIILFIDFE